MAALKKLDANSDGKLTDDEAGMKSMSPPNTGAAYSSAIAIDFGGQRQSVQLLAMTVAGVSAADGKLLWRYDKPANGPDQRNGPVTQPVHLIQPARLEPGRHQGQVRSHLY